MDKIELQIDQLEREKLISLIQQNQVRIGKHNIRYTRGNQKHTLEHWQKCLESYERLLKSIPKDLLKIEREIRKKFVEGFSEDREVKLLSLINTEIEVLIGKADKLYGTEFRKFGAYDEFETRINKAREACQELIETHMAKCWELADGQDQKTKRMSAPEICDLFKMKETFLHELNLLGPLQNINIRYDESSGEKPELHEALGGVMQGIRDMAKTLQDEGSGAMQTIKERKERKMQEARETLLFRELVINIEPLIDQAVLPEEQRNQEVMQKLWDRIEGFFINGRNDWATVLPRFKTVFTIASVNGQK